MRADLMAGSATRPPHSGGSRLSVTSSNGNDRATVVAVGDRPGRHWRVAGVAGAARGSSTGDRLLAVARGRRAGPPVLRRDRAGRLGGEGGAGGRAGGPGRASPRYAGSYRSVAPLS